MGILCVVLMIALGAIGVTYGGYWSETLDIINTVETGTWGIEISKGDCGTVTEPPPNSTEISCSVVGNELGVTITNPRVNVGYYCDFSIENNGTIPVKIQSIAVSTVPGAVVVDITGEVAEGVLIDPEEVKYGTVNIDVTNASGVDDPLSFTVTFSAVPWNQ